MDRKDMEKILDEAPVLTGIADGKSQEAFESLLKSPGLPILYGLLLGSRQGLFAALSKSPLTNMETVSRAAVIQGQISGVEIFYNTLLEQCITNEQEQK